MWGSLGWAVATFLPDCCLTSIRNLTLRSPAVPAWCSLILLATAGLLRTAGLAEAISGGKVTLEDALRLLTLPRFWALVFFVVGTCIYGVYDQQFPVYFSSQFATLQEGNAMYGYLNSFQGVPRSSRDVLRAVAG